MKSTLVVFSCIVVAVLANSLPESERLKLARVHAECQANPKTRCDENLLRNLGANANNAQVGIHMLCMSVKEGLQRPNGDLDRNFIKSKIDLVSDDKSKVDHYLQTCAVKKQTPEKTAVDLVLCFVQNGIPYYYRL